MLRTFRLVRRHRYRICRCHRRRVCRRSGLMRVVFGLAPGPSLRLALKHLPQRRHQRSHLLDEWCWHAQLMQRGCEVGGHAVKVLRAEAAVLDEAGVGVRD
eukprot:358130-Chlamydomonas_euryale.AAC.11